MIPPPPRIARLPQDKHGRPVPWFVAVIDGVPDFRIVAAGKVAEAAQFGRCFVCGEPLGRSVTFPVGPMGTINRSAPEPPSHKDCALYAVMACPFLVRPNMRRRSAGLPEGLTVQSHAPGETVAHNPGVTALWTTRSRQAFPDGRGGLLFQMGEPDEVLWYAEGRAASRAEVSEALADERDVLEQRMRDDAGGTLGAEAQATLAGAYAQAQRYLPA
jgi:hypothetical protein